jgi:hypothetical protein
VECENQIPLLAHVECVKCVDCHCFIGPNDQYWIERKEYTINIICKVCINKKNKEKTSQSNSNRHRLSSRQKEILMSRFKTQKFDLSILNDNYNDDNCVLKRWSEDIGCSIKSLVCYIRKHENTLKKTTKKPNEQEEVILSNRNPAIHSMIEQLKMMDKIAPPNRVVTFTKVSNEEEDSLKNNLNFY